jgi:hypothetical protein
MNKKASIAAAMVLVASVAQAHAEDSVQLATQLANPLAKLISIPAQGNYNSGYGPRADGDQLLVNLQPVIPFSINDDWNLISRTIVPIISQNDMFPGAGSQFGLGDTTQSLFLSPSRTVNGITWGIGPVLYIPTATDDLLGKDTFGIGPTAVALWQGKGWSVGVLANQIWSVTGDEQDEINAAYLQPFVSYTTKDAWTFALNTESTYNWDTEEWSVPANFVVSKLVRVGKVPVSLFAGARYWLDSPEDQGPEGWGGRFGFTVLLPKK